MISGIEESFVIRLAEKYKGVVTPEEHKKMFENLTCKELELKDDYIVDESTRAVKGTITNYGRMWRLKNVSWKYSMLSDLILASGLYDGGIMDYFKVPQNTAYVHYGLNITWCYTDELEILDELTDADIKKRLYDQLNSLTEYDFYDLEELLNMHKVEIVYREEFSDQPSYVRKNTLVGGIKITGSIVNGVLYLLDHATTLLITEAGKGVLTEAGLGVIIEQGDPDINNDHGHPTGPIKQDVDPRDLHTEDDIPYVTELEQDQLMTEEADGSIVLPVDPRSVHTEDDELFKTEETDQLITEEELK